MRRTLIALLIATGAAHAQTPADSPGARLYRDGAGVMAMIAGDVTLPATRFACAGCHGADGKGRREGGNIFPPIRWQDLTAAGRAAPYDTDSLLRVLTEGVDPSGRPLSRLMPRFRAEPEVMQSLVLYLQGLGAEAQTGITPTELNFASTGDAGFDAGFKAFLARFNAEGGAFGRRLMVAPSGPALDTGAMQRDQMPVLERACMDAALRAIRDDGHSSFHIIGPAPEDLPYRAQMIDLAISDAAEVALVTPGGRPDGPDTGPIYGCMDAIGPQAQVLVSDNHRLNIVLADPDALQWALESGQDDQAVAGYVFGGLVSAAVLGAGRALTPAAIAEGLEGAEPEFQIIRLP